MVKKTLILLTLTSLASANNYYIIKPGETLSDILYMNVPGRIYGSSGNLSKLRLLNETIPNLNEVSPGLRILLPKANGTYTQFELSQMKVENNTPKVSEQKRKSDHNPKNFMQSLYFKLSMNMQSLKSLEIDQGSSEVAVSNTSPKLTVRWAHHWSKKLSIFAQGWLTRQRYTVDEKVELIDQTVHSTSFGLSVNLQEENYSYALGFSLDEQLTLTALNSTQRILDKNTIPTLSIGGTRNIYSYSHNNKVKASLSTGYLFPTTQAKYETQAGYFYDFGISSGLEINQDSYSIGLNYKVTNLKTNSLEQDSKIISISIAKGFSF